MKIPYEEQKPQIEKHPQKIFGYYPSNWLGKAYFSNMFPGNFYVGRYTNFKHAPYPIFFYIGYNPRYQTFEGINFAYIPVPERIRLVKLLKSAGYLKSIFRMKSLTQENITYMRAAGGSATYYRIKSLVTSKNIVFYRRYKQFYLMPVYLIGSEYIEEAMKVITPVRPFTPQELKSINRGIAMMKNKLSRRM